MICNKNYVKAWMKKKIILLFFFIFSKTLNISDNWSHSSVNYREQYLYAFTSLIEKLQKALKTFQNGGLILVGDDGQRENEADLVFHACGASAENVNFALKHAKGLLCVSLSHEIANKLGISSAPQLPGGISHTNFTLSVDAKLGITSGISAKDRAYTISLLANSDASVLDFISPGHIFPLRAMNGGLLARAGHTEALLELCKFAKLPCVAAMCEILDDNGDAINPRAFLETNHNYSVFKDLPYITTVDLLWAKVLFQKPIHSFFTIHSEFIHPTDCEKPLAIYQLTPEIEAEISLPTTICIYNQHLNPENIYLCISNGANCWNNSVNLKTCDAAIFMYNSGNCLEKAPADISLYCDLSAKEGLNKTKVSIKRNISMLRTLQFLSQNYHFKIQEGIENLKFIVPEDKFFLDIVTNINFNLN